MTYEERNAEIVRRLKAGESIVQLAHAYGITRQRVYQISVRDGYRPQNRVAIAEKSHAKDANILEAYKPGMTVDELWDATGREERRDLMNARARRLKLQLRARPTEIKHGLVYTYQYYKCRCDACRLASSEYHREQRERRRTANPPEDLIPHGSSRYRNWGCRCDVCRKAESEYNLPYRRAYQARQRAKRQQRESP